MTFALWKKWQKAFTLGLGTENAREKTRKASEYKV